VIRKRKKHGRKNTEGRESGEDQKMGEQRIMLKLKLKNKGM
jgi:hypothetical protein